MDQIDGLFAELKVLDISSVLAGPLAGSFFAELGAHVTKIEHKSTGGDSTRQWKLPGEEHTRSISAYYASANYGKDVIQLDLDVFEDYEVLVSLLKDVDIVISNYQKKVAEKLKTTYADLKQYNENIIFAQLNAYSYDDPRPGYDMIMQAETGWISMTGTDEAHLAKLPVAIIDIMASHQIREAVLIALLKREKTGQGSEIHVSLYKSAISALANQASNYLMNDHIPTPMGTLHPNIAPYGDVFTSKDEKSLILAIGSDKQFEKLGKTLNLASELISTFTSNRDRIAERGRLRELLQLQFSKYDLLVIEQFLSDANVPFCIVNNIKEVFCSVYAREMVLSETIESVFTRKVSNIAFDFRQ